MALQISDVIIPTFTGEEIQAHIATAELLLKTMQDRADLHARGALERFINIAMGEVAEQAVIKWLQGQGKFAQSAVDKGSGRPDEGRDIVLRSNRGRDIECSVKSSLSAHLNVEQILTQFHLSAKRSEIRDINIQVYFWLKLSSRPRITVPSERNMAIIGWLGRRDLEKVAESHYATEARSVVEVKLNQMRPMSSLLEYLQ